MSQRLQHIVYPLFTFFIIFIASVHSTSFAADDVCVDSEKLQDPYDLQDFLARSGPKPYDVSIDGINIREAFMINPLFKFVARQILCLRTLAFVASEEDQKYVLRVKAKARRGEIRLVDIGVYGNKTLVDLSKTVAAIRIKNSTFSKADVCFKVRRDARISVRESTIYECGIRKQKRKRSRPLRIKFRDNLLFLTSKDALGSFLALPLRAGAQRPQLAYVNNTIYVNKKVHMRRISEMLGRPNVRCRRNKIVVFEEVTETKSRCLEVIQAKNEHERERRKKKKELEEPNWTSVDLVRVNPPDIGGGIDEEPEMTPPAPTPEPRPEPTPSSEPFKDGMLFADGTGWIDAWLRTTRACTQC